MNEIIRLLEAYQDAPKYLDNADWEPIYNFILEKQQECQVELYRGLRYVELDELQVGQDYEFKNLFESFSEDIDTAINFAADMAEGTSYRPVVLCLENTSGLPIYIYTENENEQEWLIPDQKFTISNIKDMEEYIFITLEAI